MKPLVSALVLVVSLQIAGVAAAAQQKPGQPGKLPTRANTSRADMFAEMYKLADLKLSPQQEEKAEALNDELALKLAGLAKKQEQVLTPEQKKARAAAIARAKATGKQGDDLVKAAQSAVVFSSSQKQKVAELSKEKAKFFAEHAQKVMAILTPQQKAQAKKLATLDASTRETN
jgi:hypothetical protein